DSRSIIASLKAIDIEGHVYKQYNLMSAQDLVTDYASLYELRVDDVAQLERMGKKSAQKLIDSIEASKARPLPSFVFALGIRFVGERAAKLLAERFASIDALMNATTEELVDVPEIGPKVAESVTV